MSITILGGVKSSEKVYKDISTKYGVKLKLYNQNIADFEKKVKNTDSIILFTGNVSHSMACKACNLCRKNNIPLHRSHSCGIKALEDLIKNITEKADKNNEI